jgi:hypothetical protein
MRFAWPGEARVALLAHPFRATRITDYLTNGGRIEVARRMAGHSNAKTTGFDDRRKDDISVREVERIGIWTPRPDPISTREPSYGHRICSSIHSEAARS